MVKRKWELFLLVVYAGLSNSVLGQATPLSQAPSWTAITDLAAFDGLENHRLSHAQQAIETLTFLNVPRTIDNTLLPFDEAIRQLNSAAYLAKLVEEAHPDSSYRDHATAMTHKVDAATTALLMNRDVYQALSALDLSSAAAATRFYVQRRLLMGRLAGVDKDDVARARLAKLKDELTQTESAFGRNINDDHTVFLADPSELDGLPADFLERHKPGPDGKVPLATDYTDYYPVTIFAKSDPLRRRFSEAYNNLAYPKNRDLLLKLLQLRFEIASLLDYFSWADYHVASRMTLTGARVGQFIQEVEAAAWPVAQREYALLLAEKRKAEPGATTISEYEMPYFVEQIRRSRFSFDSQLLRPYLPYARVKQAVLDSAAKLFHVTFRQEPDVKAWDPTVETWAVFDGQNMIGRFYLDMHPRPSKTGGSFETLPLLDGIAGKQLTEVALICNFPKPSANEPALMEFDEVTIFFHEFGHAMHRILGGRDQRWAGTNNRNLEIDFLETPSQLLEKWPSNPQVLASFARHYQTGEPVPSDLLTRMNRASSFGRALNTLDSNARSAISYNLHKGDPKNINPDTLWLEDIRRYSHMQPLTGTHPYASWDHLLEPYTSDYYMYLWDQVIVEDFYQRFDQKDLFAGDTPARYRRTVLEPGGSMSANDLVKNFLGRAQNIAAFRHWLGQEFETEAAIETGGKN